MFHEIEKALDAHADALDPNDDCFTCTFVDDRFDYEYGSIRGTHGDCGYEVECNGEGTLTVEVAADEVDDSVIGTAYTHSAGVNVVGPRDADVDLEYTYIVIAISDAVNGKVQVTFEFSFSGSGAGDSDPDWGRDYDDDDRYDDYCY